MRLLIVTQVVDIEHPILGFFHRWIEEFSKNCESVEVICLQAGKHSLPANVTVYSLGKEEGVGRFIYLLRFFKLIWKLRKGYDNVFVHMNQIYVILGGLFWRLSGKKIGLWYMHGTVSPSLKFADKITHKIFTGSKESCRLKSNKIIITGHGIDTGVFAPADSEKDLDLVTVGRITEAKNLMALIDILEEVRKEQDVVLSIVGASVSEAEKEYEKRLIKYIEDKGLNDHVDFVGKVSQKVLPDLLNRAKMFVTVAQNGSLDKVMLEAMACGLPVVSMAPGSASLPLGAHQTSNQNEFIQELKKVLESGNFTNHKHADYVKENHSIQSLVPKILRVF